jgi:hypothetical protein
MFPLHDFLQKSFASSLQDPRIFLSKINNYLILFPHHNKKSRLNFEATRLIQKEERWTANTGYSYHSNINELHPSYCCNIFKDTLKTDGDDAVWMSQKISGFHGDSVPTNVDPASGWWYMYI